MLGWLAASLLALALACGPADEDPPGFSDEAPAPASLQLSEAGRYRVSLRPRSGEIPLRSFHAWVFHVETLDGGFFVPARLAVDGGMPQHKHGFATAPRVTKALGDGDFLVEGVKFHMAGEWLIRFEFTGARGADRATFQVQVARETEAPSGDWSDSELELLRSLSLSSLPPLAPSPSNRVGSDPRAARLGHALFFDPRLSANGEISCATCHDPAFEFTDRLPVSEGLGRMTRNSPTLVGAAWSTWFFWDGRRDSLWSQALAPLEAPAEMGSTRLEVVRFVTSDSRYREAYVEIFGAPPDFSLGAGLPERASPFAKGDARSAWEELSPDLREQVNTAFANVGKAIAAYERELVPGPSPFDRYVDAVLAGDAESAGRNLGAEAVAGLRLFVDAARTQCLRCHNGPLLANQTFHDIGTSRLGPVPDFGRFLGAQSLLLDEFNCLGRYSDAGPDDCEQLRFLDRHEIGAASGAFKTPTLRGVARTGPYMHGGRLETLEAVMDHYRDPPGRGHELTPLELTDEESAQLVAFMEALSGGSAADPVWLSPPEPRPDPAR